MSLQSRKDCDESLGRDETGCIRLATNNVLSQVTFNFNHTYVLKIALVKVVNLLFVQLEPNPVRRHFAPLFHSCDQSKLAWSFLAGFPVCRRRFA